MFNKLSATVVFVQDLDNCRTFYQDTLGLKPLFDDDVSTGYQIDGHDLVLLKFAAAADMMSEEAIAFRKDTGYRVLLCLAVDDVDATYKTLTDKGVTFIKPPKSQHWGRRTAYFADPEGNLWELWHELPAEQN
ncbi:MAG: VOC family protein [Aggregatilineales bacterium]